MAVIGIDLGTTYSVVATPQKREGKYFETVGDVTIIKDDYNQRLTPSVVAVNSQGELLVGRRAKNLVGQQSIPIMFVKRTMGEERAFELGKRRLRPEEVSAEILRYLKALAEKQLGEAIDEAVITVPAYFTTIQKQKTLEAGELAGFAVGEILQEPVAAALTYCHDDDRDPLTIMTYDLGGGTFDVAILRKQEGVFEIKAFEGNRNLGGYDFDKRLVHWMIDQLQAQGFQIDIRADSPEWSKLLVLAETVKTKLTDLEVHSVQEQNTGIVDARGEPVVIELEITREIFEGLIKDDIEETMRLCRQALKKAGLEASALDEIVLVGGSSRLPFVARRLEAVFGRRPRLFSPDLCVAIGAALMARRLSRRIGPLRLAALPEVTNLSTIQITGSVVPTTQLPDVAGCVVVLTPDDSGPPRRQTIGAQGGFVFAGTPLAVEGSNGFSLRVEDSAGREIFTHRFAIRRDATASAAPSTAGLGGNILAKPIAIMTVGGLHVVAQERTELPYNCHVIARTEDQKGVVRIPIYEDTYRIGEIVVTDVPTDLPIGSQVEISLQLGEDFSIKGRAFIVAANIESRAEIKLPPVVVKGLAELRADHERLQRQADEALAQADRGVAFAVAGRLRDALAASRKLLYEERSPSLARAQDLLAEVATLIQQLAGWRADPPPERFAQVQRELTEELLPDLYALRPAAAEEKHEARLKAIVQKGERALADKHEATWRDANRQLDELRDGVLAAIGQERQRRGERQAGGGGQEQQPNPHAIKLKLGFDLTELREEVRRRGRLDELAPEIDACERTLKAIDPKAGDAMPRLAAYYQDLYQPLYAKAIGRAAKPPAEGLVGV